MDNLRLLREPAHEVLVIAGREFQNLSGISQLVPSVLLHPRQLLFVKKFDQAVTRPVLPDLVQVEHRDSDVEVLDPIRMVECELLLAGRKPFPRYVQIPQFVDVLNDDRVNVQGQDSVQIGEQLVITGPAQRHVGVAGFHIRAIGGKPLLARDIDALDDRRQFIGELVVFDQKVDLIHAGVRYHRLRSRDKIRIEVPGP